MSQSTTNGQIEKGYLLLNKLLAMQTSIDNLERAPVDDTQLAEPIGE